MEVEEKAVHGQKCSFIRPPQFALIEETECGDPFSDLGGGELNSAQKCRSRGLSAGPDICLVISSNMAAN